MKNRKNFGKKLVGLVLAALMILSVSPMSVISTFAAENAKLTELSVTIDTGAEVTLKDADNDGFYDIGNADELYAFAALVNGGNFNINAELTADIVVNKGIMSENTTNARVWTPIGKDYETGYTGSFNGNNKKISGLFLKDPKRNNVALFGEIKDGSVVENLTVENTYFEGYFYVGGIVAGSGNSTIENCINKATIKGSSYVGGIFANGRCWVKNCANLVPITGSYSYVGGISGYNSQGTLIENSYNAGDIIVKRGCAGGISGYNDSGSVGRQDNQTKIINCFNTGNINGHNALGGIVSYTYFSIIENCYNTGSVSGYENIGGIAATHALENQILKCYNTGLLTGSLDVGGIVGVDDGTEYNITIMKDNFCSDAVFKYGGSMGEGVTSFTPEQFKSGEAAYVMNNGVTDGTQL